MWILALKRASARQSTISTIAHWQTKPLEAQVFLGLYWTDDIPNKHEMHIQLLELITLWLRYNLGY